MKINLTRRKYLFLIVLFELAIVFLSAILGAYLFYTEQPHYYSPVDPGVDQSTTRFFPDVGLNLTPDQYHILVAYKEKLIADNNRMWMNQTTNGQQQNQEYPYVYLILPGLLVVVAVWKRKWIKARIYHHSNHEEQEDGNEKHHTENDGSVKPVKPLKLTKPIGQSGINVIEPQNDQIAMYHSKISERRINITELQNNQALISKVVFRCEKCNVWKIELPEGLNPEIYTEAEKALAYHIKTIHPLEATEEKEDSTGSNNGNNGKNQPSPTSTELTENPSESTPPVERDIDIKRAIAALLDDNPNGMYIDKLFEAISGVYRISREHFNEVIKDLANHSLVNSPVSGIIVAVMATASQEASTEKPIEKRKRRSK